jgi:hypothetical protein
MGEKVVLLYLPEAPEPEPPNRRWLDHQKKQYKKYDKMEREAVATAMWNKGRILCEVRKKYKHRKQGFVRLVETEFERSLQTAYNYMKIYNACPKPELLHHFPLWLLRMIGSSTCPEEFRERLHDNAEQLRKDITEKEAREVLDTFRKLDSESDRWAVMEKLFEEREEKAKQYEYRRKIDNDLKRLEKLWKDFDDAASTGLTPDEDGIVRLTEEQEKMLVVRKLKELGYLSESDYELFVEVEVSNRLKIKTV